MMKNIKLIVAIGVLLALLSCEEKINRPDLSNEYPRIMSTWPIVGTDGTLGAFEINVGDTLRFGFMYTPSSALSEWYLDGKKIGEGADFNLTLSSFGSYHLKVVVSNDGKTTFREATIKVNDPTLNMDLVKNRYYVSPDEELPLSVTYTPSENTMAFWYMNGIKVAEGANYTFNQSELGSYTLKVEVKNAISSLSKQFVVVVRNPNVVQNVALFEDCVATASGYTNDDENPNKARDGIADGTKWCDASSTIKWLMYKFETPVREITKFVLDWENWDVNRNYKIETSIDGEVWEEAVQTTDNTNDPRESVVSIKGVRFVKFTLMEVDDAIRLMEFEIWGIR